MEEIISCCGSVCPACPYYPADCRGCAAVKGNVFWLAYTGGTLCDIYRCCVLERGLFHCGRCGELPCRRYAPEDPTKTAEENAADLKGQLEQLRRMAAADEEGME